MPLLFVEEAKLPKVAKVLGECPRLKIVVVLTKAKAGTASSSKDKLVAVSNGYSAPAEVQKACDAAGVRLLGFDALLQSGADNPAEPSPPSGDDLAFIMYTSGTTGDPKGVRINQLSISVSASHSAGLVFHPTDRYLSYLPLAHIFETNVEFALLAAGASIGFFGGNIRKA